VLIYLRVFVLSYCRAEMKCSVVAASVMVFSRGNWCSFGTRSFVIPPSICGKY